MLSFAAARVVASARLLGSRGLAAAAKKSIQVTFIKPDGSKQVVSAPVGDSMLEVAHANKIDIEGACCGAGAMTLRGAHCW
jgi:hypothetical protein